MDKINIIAINEKGNVEEIGEIGENSYVISSVDLEGNIIDEEDI